jgi:hypothetical protein
VRLQRLCSEALGQPIFAGTATFPRDGWMFFDLIDAAERQARALRTGNAAAGLS